MDTAPTTPKTVAVQPIWWADLNRELAELVSGIARVAALIAGANPAEIDPVAIGRLLNILITGGDTAEVVAEALQAVVDGTSPHLIGVGDPPPVDFLALTRKYRAGLVVGAEVIAEAVGDHGDGPDALPNTLIAMADRLRKLKPGAQAQAQLIVLLDEIGDATPAPVAS